MPTNDDEQAKNQPKPNVPSKKAKPVTVKSAAVKPKVKKTDSLATTSTVKPNTNEAPKVAVRKASGSTGDVSANGSGSVGEAKHSEPVAVGGGDRRLKGAVIKVAAIIVAVIIVVVIVFGVLIYGYKSENPVVKAVAEVVPYPVEQVNGQFVSYNDYLFEVNANERAYQNNAKLNNQPTVDFTTAAGQKLVTQIKQHAMQTLVSDAVIAQLASQKKVTVSDKDVNNLINQLYQRYGGKATLLKTLNQIYGWNLNDLTGVVRQQLLAQDLQNEVTSDPALEAAAKAKAENVLTQIKNGSDFSTLAKTYSQASDASNGGNLGYFTKGQLPDALQTAAEALQPGQVSDVIKDTYGYEIIKVLDKKSDGSIEAQHILIETVDFNTYLQQQIKKAKVSTYLNV